MNENIKFQTFPEKKIDINLNSPEKESKISNTNIKENFPSVEKSTYESNIGHKNSSQVKALFYKNLTMQSRQIATNICQITTPLICLTLILVIQKIAETVFPGSLYSMPIPMILNIPSFYNLFQSNLLPIKVSNCLQWYYYDFHNNTDQQTIDFVGFNEGSYEAPRYSNGLLSNIINNYSCEYGKFNQTEPLINNIPFFKRPPENSTINDEIYKEMIFLNSQPYRRWEDLLGLEILPDGAIKFYEANKNKLSFTLQINDLRIPEYHRNNGITKLTYQSKEGGQSYPSLTVADGQLSLLDLISRAYMHNLNSSIWLVSGIQYMPLKDQDKSWLLRIINITGASLYPLALSLLLPVFMYALVLEKEEKLVEMMKMNGMKMRNYWMVNYFFNFVIYLIMVILFMLFGYFLVELSFFTRTSPILLALTMIGWGMSQVSLSIFYQVFLTKARSATIVGYILSIFTILTAVSFNVAVYPEPYHLPYGMRMYPPFGFCRLIYLMSIACSNSECYRYMNNITDEMLDCVIFLYVGAFFFFLIGIYLHEVVPQDYGTPKHPLFFLSFCKYIKKKLFNKNKDSNYSNLSNIEFKNNNDSITIETELEDTDSKNERNFVLNLRNNISDYALVCVELQKIYKSIGGRPKNFAVKQLSLAIKKGEIFGLLGPNGAGKTTLISMITGLYEPDSGNAWLSGYDIKSQIEKVHLNIGVCPQFDLLWPDLTVEEHLLFYARLKGVSSKEEKAKLDKALQEVYLEKFKGFKASELSGGMKRRLSVAISLVGDPKIIFLDEPTTGLDPENKRQLWDILVQNKGKRAVLLTTHSMEEADVLCSRIGIITKGILRCIGPQVRLKSLYGKGYHLSLNCFKERYLEKIGNINCSELKKTMSQYHSYIIEFIQKILPKAVLLSTFNGNFSFQVPIEGLEVSTIFEILENKKSELMISDWGISQSSLEDVFMQIVDNTN